MPCGDQALDSHLLHGPERRRIGRPATAATARACRWWAATAWRRRELGELTGRSIAYLGVILALVLLARAG
jgi:hypothetical protein